MPTSSTPLPIINCSIEPTTITVGQKAVLKCQTDGVASPEQIQFAESSSGQPYTIQFLSPPQIVGGELQQVVTSYLVGSHDISDLK